MSHIHYFALAVTVTNSIWALTWSRGSWANVAIKLAFAGLAIWGWYLIFRGIV